ncbi:MAG TPA: MMPL family transporter [Pirellulales bacterium]|nr:MMPL family transporter [Pirellulales bacterium]
MWTSVAKRRFQLLLLFAALLLPAIIYGAREVLRVNRNSPFEWVPTSFAPRQEYEQFRAAFGSGEVLVVSWPGCTIDSPELDFLTKSLRRPDLFESEAREPYVDQVVSGQEALRKLMADPLKLSREDAIARLRGTLIGPDGKTTCAVITLTPTGLAERSRVVELIRSGLAKYCRVPAEAQHYAGPVIDGLSVDQASNQSLNRFAVPSAVAVFLICWCWLRWLPGALLVFAISVYCEVMTLSLIHWCGGQMSALLIVLPPLIQVITASGGIHLINYYLVALKSYDPERSALGALKLGWVPCTLSAVTNAIGLGALYVSHISPVRDFGIYGALGVMFTLGAVLALVPGLLMIWRHKGIARSGTLNLEDGSFHGDNPFWKWLSRFVSRYHPVIVAGSVVLMIGMGWGLQWLRTSVHIRTLFSADSRILSDYQWIEDHVGPMAPIEVVASFRPDCPLSPADRFAILGRIQDELRHVELVKGTVSCANMMPALPADVDPRGDEYRRFIADILEMGRPQFTESRYLHETSDGQQWRITAYVSALQDTDYAGLLATIRRRLDSILSEGRPGRGVELHVTGVLPLVHAIQDALMQDLIASFLSAFGIILIVMTIGQAGIATGLISMIPNLFPMVFMFGLLGWLRSPLDIGSVMTASIALGIAIDDVLHFLTFFRRALERGQSRIEAVHTTYQQCGFAMFVSSVVCGLAPMVFYFSDFVPASRFATMMLLLLTIAVIGDMVLLPALMAGPAGKLFERQYRKPLDPTPEKSTAAPLPTAPALNC